MKPTLWVFVLVLGAAACTESGGTERAGLYTDQAPPQDARGMSDAGSPPDAETVLVQPSCTPAPYDDEGGFDDGETCDDGGYDDVICDIVPDPTLYCVTCSDGSSACHPYPPDVL